MWWLFSLFPFFLLIFEIGSVVFLSAVQIKEAEVMVRSVGGGVQLPSGVLDRLPFLKDEVCVFFDFGLMLFAPPSVQGEKGGTSAFQVPIELMTREPIVAVITEKGLVAATFPRATRPPRTIPHDKIAGISKEEDRVLVRLNGEPDVHLMLSKGDTFVVYLVDLQDRSMGRAIHFAPRSQQRAAASQQQQLSTPGGGAEASSHAMSLTASALQASQTAQGFDEATIGVIRFGRASKRIERPPTELDEGSDASSVATVDHLVDDTDDGQPSFDFPLVSIDATSLRRRLFYFFQQYDRSKLAYVDDMLRHYAGKETQLLHELELQYGPEPNKTRWETRDQLAHQRKLHDQLTAQLKRAQDELLLLAREETALATSRQRSSQFAEEYAERLRAKFLVSRRYEKSAGDGAAAGADTASSSAGLRLLSVAHLTPSPVDGTLTADAHASWLAPDTFFEFVRDQAGRVQGAGLPPLCVVQDESKSDKPSFLCNWSFLAGWAQDFGPHSVAVTSKSGEGTVRFVRSTEYWKRV